MERKKKCKGKVHKIQAEYAIYFFPFKHSTSSSCHFLQVWQELDLSTTLGHQEGSDNGLFHWIYVAGHLPVLWSGLLVWLLSGGGHRRVHTRNTTAGITLTPTAKYALSYEHWSKKEIHSLKMKHALPSIPYFVLFFFKQKWFNMEFHHYLERFPISFTEK